MYPQTDLNSHTAVIFPGQGSQHRSIRTLVEEHRPDLLERAVEIVGDDPFARAAESTRFLQPAVYCASLAGWERYRQVEEGVPPDYFAGHSLGEFAALVAAESLDEIDGLRLVVIRGEVLERAARELTPAMMAVIGPGVQGFGAQAASFGVAVAGDNSPDQIVLCGPREHLEAARQAAVERSLDARVLRIATGGHTPAFEKFAPDFAEALAKVDFRTPTRPVFSGVTAAPFDETRRLLAESLRSTVRWRQIATELHRRGVRRFVEAGPGHVLLGLVRRTFSTDIELMAMDDSEVRVA